MDWDTLADDKTLEKTAKALAERGFGVIIVKDRNDAKAKLFELLPIGSEILENSSTTLDEIGVGEELGKGGRYVSIRKKITSINDKGERDKARRASATCDYAIGSVQAITQDGEVLVASQSGSNIAPYAFCAKNVVWVAGTNKIVKDRDKGIRRLYEHCLVLENERAKRVYGFPSSLNKMLILEKEPNPGRIKLILVKEKLGF